MTPVLPDSLEMRMRLFYIGEFGLMETGFSEFNDIAKLREESTLVWLHVSGTLGEEFWKHLADFLDFTDEQIKYVRGPHRRSFFDEFPNGMFWTLQRPAVSENIESVEVINFFMTHKLLVTRQFSHDSAWSVVSHKLMARGEQIADYTVDRLAAELVDDVINCYVDVLKLGGHKLENIQNKIIRNPGKAELDLINRAQQVIWIFLNTVWPVETVVHGIARSRSHLLSPQGREEFAHRRDEISSVVRLFETYREMSYDLMDVYVSRLGLRTSETTTILTIIATLFLPPTLIAGIYGMNFNIPEIHLAWGYYVCLGAMFLVSGGLLVWLKWRGFIEF